MKKLYALTSGDYSDYTILGLFDNKKIAFKLLKQQLDVGDYTCKSDIKAYNNLTLKNFTGNFWGYSIEEYPLNKLHPNFSI